MRCSAFGCGVAAALLLIVMPRYSSVSAQGSRFVPELPLTRDCGTSARALGMGGAYLAVSDDAAALRFNPAGLARVQRVELSGSLTDRSRTLETRYLGNPEESRLSRSHVSSLGFVYPFATYRGSLVLGIGYAAPWPFDLEYSRSAAAHGYALQEQLVEEGALGEWSVALGVDASPTLALGFKLALLHGSRFQDWSFRGDPIFGEDSLEIHDVTDLTLNGFTGSFGAQSRMGAARIGIVADLPRWVFQKGTEIRMHPMMEDEIYDVDERLTLPFSVGLGAALPWRRLLLAGDARFTDWTQIDFKGPLRYYVDPETETRREFAYQRTWDLHLGAEYLVDLIRPAGLRLRAGWSFDPLPYRVLLEEYGTRPDPLDPTNFYLLIPVYRAATYDPERMTWSVGVGILAGESLTLDAAFTTGSWTRTGVNLSEEETEKRLLVSAAFRLE